MWATDAASPIGRTLGAGIAALLLAGSVLGAPATPPTVTDADIERARQQHRMPTEAELAKVPVPGTPRIENLPQPMTRMPIDLEAISKGFDLDLMWFPPIEGLTLQGGLTNAETTISPFVASDLLVPSRFNSLRRLPGESLEDMEARAIASIKGPGLAMVLADYD